MVSCPVSSGSSSIGVSSKSKPNKYLMHVYFNEQFGNLVLVDMILSSILPFLKKEKMLNGIISRDLVLQGNLQGSFIASFAVGYACTTVSGHIFICDILNMNHVAQGAALASYPLDTIRRRMMMSSGEAVSSWCMDAITFSFLVTGSI